MKSLVFTIIILSSFNIGAQNTKSDGPLIKGYGHVWDIKDLDYPTDTSMTYKVIFDIHNTPEDYNQTNPQINTIARFLNMHLNAGIPIEKLQVAAVFHNKASKDILDDEHYQERFGTTNPNSHLLSQLLENNIDLFFCGQSSYSRNIPKEEIISGIQLSLSAMTVILAHTHRDYTMIRF